MKFSHSIQFNAVPDWSSHYIAYSNLKKLIYQLEKNVHQTESDAESRPLIGIEEPEKVFSRSLDVELEKVSSFFSVKEQELIDEALEVLKDAGEFKETGDRVGPLEDSPEDEGSLRGLHRHHRSSTMSTRSSDDGNDESEDEDDEATGLTRKTRPAGQKRSKTIPAHMMASVTSMTASTDLRSSFRRNSTVFDDYAEQAHLYQPGIMLKKRLVSIYVSFCELKSFIQLNKTGFRKVLKKFDKICDCKLKNSYMERVVEPAYPFLKETMKRVEDHISKIEKAYAALMTNGDEEAARKDLRSHLREHVVWERNTVWRDLIGIERRAEAATLGRALLGRDTDASALRLQGDDEQIPKSISIATPLGRFNLPTWLANSSMITLLTLIIIFLVLLYVPILDAPEQQNCLAMLVFVSLLWATEAIPLFVTSLLVPFLAVVLQVVRDNNKGKMVRLHPKEGAKYVFSSMWTPVIMLLLGGFTLAAAVSKCKIDKRMATFVLSKAGTSPKVVLIANMLVAAFASMLISNVAAPVLCYSIIDPVLRNLPHGSSMSKAIIIGIAMASNIGGMLSPIASPQNVIALDYMNPQPTWGAWFFIVIPVGLISMFLIWLLLLVTFKPSKGTSIVAIRPVREPFTPLQWFVTIVSVATIGLWCASHQLEGTFGDMGVIALIPITLFFGIGVLTKEDFNNFPWTIIILAAGGLALGNSVTSSGLLHVLADAITEKVEGLPTYAVLVVFSCMILVIATFISHTVAALIFLPLVAKVGAAMETDQSNILVMAGVLMCSGAMALPTSGFPNMTAIMKEDALGHRYLNVKHFISRGIPSSLITLTVVITLGYGCMRIVF